MLSFRVLHTVDTLGMLGAHEVYSARRWVLADGLIASHVLSPK